MEISTFTLGDWRTNCYVVAAGGDCWIVDAGFEPGEMIAFIQERGLTPRRVVLTHGHVDHIAGLHAVRARWPKLPIVIHEAERAFLSDTSLNLSVVLPDPVVAPEPTATLQHGDVLTLGESGPDFAVRHVPGHSPGGVCLYDAQSGTAIVGDTLFAGGIGRYDFPTSDGTTLLRSIREQLMTLPQNTRVLPGHGPETTIARERADNPFLGAR